MLTNKDLRKWQKRLGLQDWCLSMTTEMRPDHTRRPQDQGNTEYIESSKEADIQIVALQYLDRSYGRSPDDLYILVHELLEIKLSLLRDSSESLQDRYVHQLIDDLARAFVDAERSGSAQKPERSK